MLFHNGTQGGAKPWDAWRTQADSLVIRAPIPKRCGTTLHPGWHTGPVAMQCTQRVDGVQAATQFRPQVGTE